VLRLVLHHSETALLARFRAQAARIVFDRGRTRSHPLSFALTFLKVKVARSAVMVTQPTASAA
jgi:hypothetical protein